MNVYNLYNIEAQIKDLLIAGNISPVSVRNYISDFRFFYGWYINIHQGQPSLKDLDEVSLIAYKQYLSDAALPLTTVNRRLSGMRKLCDCLRKMNIVSGYPEKSISNLSSLQIVTDTENQEREKLLSEYKYSLLLSNPRINDINKQIEGITDLLNLINVK